MVFWELGRFNYISKTNYAIWVQIGTNLWLTSDHIMLKYEVNRTVTFWDIAKIANFHDLKSIVGGVSSSGNFEMPACVFKVASNGA